MHNRRHYEKADEMGWSAFITGALIGAGVALLLAPQRGAELRDMLSDYANRAKDDLLEKAEEAYDKGEEVVRDAARSAREFAQQGQVVVNDAGRSAQEFAKHAQDAVQEAKG